jgi:DNA polymerase-3 subunit beta
MAFKNEGIDISADSYDLGKATDHIDARIEGPDANISFNIDYIQDFLRIFGDGELKIGINDPLSPAVFSFEENEDFIYIVTPIRTQ